MINPPLQAQPPAPIATSWRDGLPTDLLEVLDAASYVPDALTAPDGLPGCPRCAFTEAGKRYRSWLAAKSQRSRDGQFSHISQALIPARLRPITRTYADHAAAMSKPGGSGNSSGGRGGGRGGFGDRGGRSGGHSRSSRTMRR